MIDTRLVDGPFPYTPCDSVYSATAPVTVRPWMSGAGEQVPAGAIYGPFLARQLMGFFSVCSLAYTLMHYVGPLVVRVVLKPASPYHLVLNEAYLTGGYLRLLPLSRQYQMLAPETNSTVAELENQRNEVARRLVTRVFHSFGLNDLAEDTERELRAF